MKIKEKEKFATIAVLLGLGHVILNHLTAQQSTIEKYLLRKYSQDEFIAKMKSQNDEPSSRNTKDSHSSSDEVPSRGGRRWNFGKILRCLKEYEMNLRHSLANYCDDYFQDCNPPALRSEIIKIIGHLVYVAPMIEEYEFTELWETKCKFCSYGMKDYL